MAEKKLTWKEQFVANYKNKSEEAKELVEMVGGANKFETYKGDKYIPWATIERLSRLQDEDLSIQKFNELVLNKYEIKTVIKGEETIAESISPMVKVMVTFMGKSIVELFPIQQKDYSAGKNVDQNLINKAFQRAATRALARITGLGLRLYEKGDLQYEDDEKVLKPKEKSVTKPIEAPVVTKEVKKELNLLEGDGVGVIVESKPIEKKTPPIHLGTPTSTGDIDENILDLLNTLNSNKDNPKVVSFIKSINGLFVKKYGVALDLTKSDNENASVLELAPSVEAIKNKLLAVLGV